MLEVWAVIVGVIVLLIIYGIVSSKLKENTRLRQREKSLPFVEDNLVQGVEYNLFLSDGKKYIGVQLLGTSDSKSGRFSLGRWEGMLILRQSNGERVFIRQGSVRCVEET